MDFPSDEITTDTRTQAERILAKFGGARRLFALLKAVGATRYSDPTAIYKWTYPKAKGGTGGRIPTAAWPEILLAARAEGILISSEDMDPRPKAIPPVRIPKTARHCHDQPRRLKKGKDL